jgi:hypothetical protein
MVSVAAAAAAAAALCKPVAQVLDQERACTWATRMMCKLAAPALCSWAAGGFSPLALFCFSIF